MSTAPTPAWRPILDGPLAADAEAAILDIASALRTVPSQGAEALSLAGGAAGLAIFYSYLAVRYPSDGYADLAMGRLESAVEAVASEQSGASLYSGFTGVAWMMAHLTGRLLSLDDEDPNEAVDDALATHLAHTPWKDDYDLIGGLAGFGVYALERLPRPSAHRLLELIVDRLDEIAERGATGITWWTSPDLLIEPTRAEYPKGYHNLGLAHGVPGVIAFLGAACAAGVARSSARVLLDGAVAWLLAQQLPPSADGCYASFVAPDLHPEASRSAWCYGDPGVSAALLVAARAVGEPVWEREARSIARRAARRAPERASANDAGLCHGAIGLAHVFNRIHQATGDAACAEAARYWFEQGLKMRKPGEGLGGFQAWVPMPGDLRRLQWADDPGLLTGSAGIALALLAAISTAPPAWDRMLLLSA